MEVAASVPAPDPQIGECVEELRRIGQNLNQEVRRGHKRGGDAESLARLLGETIKKVDDLRAALGDRTAV
nr:MobC family plasmid mobilization relaxosome protein [Nesterenkonia populi]